MKSLSLFLGLALSIATLTAFASEPGYIVKSFKLLGDEVLSQQLTAFSQKNKAEIVSCNLTKTDMICVFRPKSKNEK